MAIPPHILKLDRVAQIEPKKGAYTQFSGPQIGGRCRVADSVATRIDGSPGRLVAGMRLKLRKECLLGTIPHITSHNIDDYLRQPNIRLTDAYTETLKLFQNSSLGHGVWLPIFEGSQPLYLQLSTILGIDTGPSNDLDPRPGIIYHLNYLTELGLLKHNTGDHTFYITPKGLLEIEKNIPTIDSTQGFVAMWFSKSTTDLFTQCISPAISLAGYTPFRIDGHEHSNRIDDEIISQIRKSRFLIADFTCEQFVQENRTVAEHRGGVYFEAGLALGLGLPVIWMVRSDCLSLVHFDTRQYNHIVWSPPSVASDWATHREALKNRIVALIGEGPRKQ